MIRTVFQAGVGGAWEWICQCSEWKIGEEEKHRFGGCSHLQVRRGGGSRPQNGAVADIEKVGGFPRDAGLANRLHVGVRQRWVQVSC